MELKQEQLDELFNKFGELEKLQEMINIKHNNAKIEFGDREIILQEEGKEDIITKESVAWQELTHPMLVSRARTALEKVYPDIFENIKQENELAKSIDEYENQIFGFTTNGMSRMNLIKLIQVIIKLEKGK